MQLKKLLEKWDLTSLKIRAPFMEMSWEPRDEDKTAAWGLYVELITRVATQHLEPDEGDEVAAVKSIADLFSLTRETIKRNGRYCIRRCVPSPRNGIGACSARRSRTQKGRPCEPGSVSCKQICASTRACSPTWLAWKTLPI